jgi:hypothetical protein
MLHEDLRLKALHAAQQEQLSGDKLMARAEEIYQWLRYGSDGATEARKALDGITMTDARTGESRPAKVVGRDSDILDRLRDSDGYRKSE